MKLPRDMSGQRLARMLAVFGYAVTRQVGSHLRLTTVRNGEHHITIPAHHVLKVGMLGAVLTSVGLHLGLSQAEVMRQLFAEAGAR